jgi:tRNA (guanine37-N1)-methyltransferase
MRYAKVPKGVAESTRMRLLSKGGLDLSAQVRREGDFVYFPITACADVGGSETVEMRGERRALKPRSLREALKDALTAEEHLLLPSSYNIVGDIAVLELPEPLTAKRKVIGEALLATFPAIKVAAAKVMEVSGLYRVPGVEVVAGEARTETVHREHGCLYRLDVGKAYFSPRLGRERMRVVKQIRDGERVLVMFAGVGPYAILAAKRTKAEVSAVELNPSAVEYMRWNVLRNKVKVDVIEGDARVKVPGLGLFDRIVMPLPKQADSFLDVAIPALKKGGIIHYYTFAHDTLEATCHLAETVGALGHSARILEAVPCGSYSPCMDRICVDFKVD